MDEAVKGAKLDDETLAAYRRAVIAAADVLLWNGKIEGSRGLYDRAEKLGDRFIPLFGFEHEVRFPEGHRIALFSRRGIRPLPHLPARFRCAWS